MTLTGENGILTRANDAKTETEIADEKEAIQLAYAGAIAEKRGTGNVTASDLNTEFETNGNNATATDGTNGEITVTFGAPSNRIYAIDKNGNINGPKQSTEVENWKENSDGTISNSDGSITLSIGDYINYDPTNGGKINKSYVAPKGTDGSKITLGESLEEGTGYSEEQEYTIDTDTKWRVLGIENGQIKLISADTLDTELSLRGQTGYQYGVTILNNICSIYGYGTGATNARSVNVEDVNEITGYDPRNIENNLVTVYGNQVTYTLNPDTGYINYQGTKYPTNLTNSTFNTLTYFNNGIWNKLLSGESKKITCTGYSYYPETLTESSDGDVVGISKDSVEYDVLFGKTTSGWYHLASQYERTEAGGYNLGLRAIYCGASVNMYPEIDSTDEIKSQERGVRVVVYLKPDIKLEKGKDTKDWIIIK